MHARIALSRESSSQCIQTPRCRRSGYRSRPRNSCSTHASATRLFDLAAWARLPDPPVRVYPPDQP
eukprot:6431350-Pyramimonas_sp.AAC.1